VTFHTIERAVQMRALIGFSALAIIGVGPLVVRWVVQRIERRPDRAWKPTGYRYLYTGHDQVLGQQSATRAAETAAKRLVIASARSMPLSALAGERAISVASTPVATPQRVARIVDIRRRQATRTR
jgi:hypothetical protein